MGRAAKYSRTATNEPVDFCQLMSLWNSPYKLTVSKACGIANKMEQLAIDVFVR